MVASLFNDLDVPSLVGTSAMFHLSFDPTDILNMLLVCTLANCLNSNYFLQSIVFYVN